MRPALFIYGMLLMLAPVHPVQAQGSAAASGSAGKARAQIVDYATAYSSNPYLWGDNAATLGFMDQKRIATAQASFGKQNGALHSLEQSPDSFDAGAFTESFIRVSDHLSFHGKLGYEYFRGNSMGGQILMDPEYNPVNFLEGGLTDLGVKSRELYTLSGGMSWRFNDKWSAGASLDYQAGDQVKFKDPRFQSSWMDLGANVGLSFRPSGRADFGVAFKWRSTLEQILGGIYGTNDRQYFVYADKGGFYGTVEQLGGDNNYISASALDLRPMSNSFYGATIQANFHSADASSSIFNTLEVLYRSGCYGLRSSSTPVYFEFSGLELSYGLTWRLLRGGRTHMTSLHAGWKPLSNNENSYRYNTPEGQNTIVEYLGSNMILDKNTYTASLAYSLKDASTMVLGFLPKAEYGVNADFYGCSSTTTLYPFYRNRQIFKGDIAASARGNFALPRSSDFCLFAGAALNAHAGAGNPADDGSYASSSGSTLQSFDTYLYRQWEYDTAARLGASAEFGCVWRIKAATISVSVSDSLAGLVKTPQYLDGRIRNCASLKIGCNF